jgi:proteic killer suppression protein
VIKSFKHKGLQALFEKDSRAGITPTHVEKLRRILARLNVASKPSDVNVPGWALHPLKGDMAGQWAVSVSGNWRLTFEFDGTDVVLVDYKDYH